MATHEATARLRADALQILKETGPQIAAQVGIEPPKLDFFYKDPAYQQAQELAVLAAFSTRLLNTLNTRPEGDEDDDQSGAETLPKRRSARAALPQR